MNFQEKFVHVFCNLIPVLEFASGQLSQLMTEEMHKSKRVGTAELSLEMKFEMGPFERPDDSLYRNHRYLKAVHLKIMKIRERIAKIKGGKQKAHQDISNWKNMKENAQQEKQKIRFEGGQTKRMSSTASEESQVTAVLHQITAIRDEISKFKTLSDLLADLKAEVHKMETALTVEPFEKLLNLLERTFSASQNKMAPITGNIFNGINNVTYNNEYHIENVFTINRLPEAKEMAELTAHKPNEALEKAVDNLKADDERVSLQEHDLELLDELQKNFSRVFGHQNVTLEQMNQMSRIIDFVERYHGAIDSLSVSGKKKEEEGRERGEGERWKQEVKGKVLCEEGVDFFGGEEEYKRPVSRRKGSVRL